MCRALIISACAQRDSELHNCVCTLIFCQALDCLFLMTAVSCGPWHMDWGRCSSIFSACCYYSWVVNILKLVPTLCIWKSMEVWPFTLTALDELGRSAPPTLFLNKWAFCRIMVLERIDWPQRGCALPSLQNMKPRLSWAQGCAQYAEGFGAEGCALCRAHRGVTTAPECPTWPCCVGSSVEYCDGQGECGESWGCAEGCAPQGGADEPVRHVCQPSTSAP